MDEYKQRCGQDRDDDRGRRPAASGGERMMPEHAWTSL
jgi:hypothetical protein